jgi:hypothetical protein
MAVMMIMMMIIIIMIIIMIIIIMMMTIIIMMIIMMMLAMMMIKVRVCLTSYRPSRPLAVRIATDKLFFRFRFVLIPHRLSYTPPIYAVT